MSYSTLKSRLKYNKILLRQFKLHLSLFITAHRTQESYYDVSNDIQTPLKELKNYLIKLIKNVINY